MGGVWAGRVGAAGLLVLEALCGSARVLTASQGARCFGATTRRSPPQPGRGSGRRGRTVARRRRPQHLPRREVALARRRLARLVRPGLRVLYAGRASDAAAAHTARAARRAGAGTGRRGDAGAHPQSAGRSGAAGHQRRCVSRGRHLDLAVRDQDVRRLHLVRLGRCGGRDYRRLSRRRWAIGDACLVLAFAAMVITLGSGDYQIPPGEVLRTLVGGGTVADHFIVVQLRLPRVVTAMLVGGALALAGAAFQSAGPRSVGEPGHARVHRGCGDRCAGRGGGRREQRGARVWGDDRRCCDRGRGLWARLASRGARLSADPDGHRGLGHSEQGQRLFDDQGAVDGRRAGDAVADRESGRPGVERRRAVGGRDGGARAGGRRRVRTRRCTSSRWVTTWRGRWGSRWSACA